MPILQRLKTQVSSSGFCLTLWGGSPSVYLGDLQQDTTFVYVRRRADTDTFKIESTDEKNLKGVYFVNNTKRVHPYGNVGVQILGFVKCRQRGGLHFILLINDILQANGHMIVITALQAPIAGGTRAYY